jgi:hypothetical protein
MSEPYTGPTAGDLENALRAFDGKESGALSITTIQTLLTTMGDKLALADIKPVLDALPHTNGQVDINELVQFLTPPIPTAKPDVDELLRELIREEAKKMNFSSGAAAPADTRPAARLDVGGTDVHSEGDD